MIREPFSNGSTPRNEENWCGRFVKILPPPVVEGFHDRLADLAQQQAFQARHALAIIRTHLRHLPVQLFAAASAAVTDCGRPAGLVAQARDSRGGKLALLEEQAGHD